jgi:hypothetical protein
VGRTTCHRRHTFRSAWPHDRHPSERLVPLDAGVLDPEIRAASFAPVGHFSDFEKLQAELLSFFASKRTKDVSLHIAKTGPRHARGRVEENPRYFNGVTIFCSIGGNSVELNLSEISESLRKFGGRFDAFSWKRCSDLHRDRICCRSHAQRFQSLKTRSSLHRMYIRLATESARSQPARLFRASNRLACAIVAANFAFRSRSAFFIEATVGW